MGAGPPVGGGRQRSGPPRRPSTEIRDRRSRWQLDRIPTGRRGPGGLRGPLCRPWLEAQEHCLQSLGEHGRRGGRGAGGILEGIPGPGRLQGRLGSLHVAVPHPRERLHGYGPAPAAAARGPGAGGGRRRPSRPRVRPSPAPRSRGGPRHPRPPPARRLPPRGVRRVHPPRDRGDAGHRRGDVEARPLPGEARAARAAPGRRRCRGKDGGVAMSATCADLEAALRGDDAALAEAFARHAEGCAACREELALAEAISAAAPSLRKEWPSPFLEARIRASLVAERKTRRRFALNPAAWLSLAAAVLVVAVAARVFLAGPKPLPGGEAAAIDESRRLLTEKALGEVERAEQAYAQSIDALSAVAASRLKDADSPVLANYREKLLLLDAAIADCRAQVERNRFNAHLRLELLSIYQEKQRTLQSLLKEDIDAL